MGASRGLAKAAATSRGAVMPTNSPSGSFDRLTWQMHDDLLTDVSFEQLARFCPHPTTATSAWAPNRSAIDG